MTERDLENIITAYDEGSFQKAAEKLYITQPALSQSIRKLEMQLGGKLFICRGNRVEPTELCGNIVAYGRPVYRQWIEFGKKTALLLNQKKDSVTVISSEAILTLILFPAIRRFKLEHPEIQFQILERRSMEAENDLAEGKADLALFAQDLGGKQITSVPVLPTEYYLAIPGNHPYAEEHPFTGFDMMRFADLRDFRTSEFVLPRHQNRVYAEQMRIFEEAGFRPRSGIETATSNTLISYVQSGLYCALIKSCYAGNYTDIPGIHYYRLDLQAARGYIYACRPAAIPFSPVIEELLKEIRKTARNDRQP